MVSKYRCDVPMAEKMGINKYCDGQCNGCLCAIKTDPLGQDEHVSNLSQPSKAFTERNLDVMSGRIV